MNSRTSRSSSGHDRMKAGAPAYGLDRSADNPVVVARTGSGRLGEGAEEPAESYSAFFKYRWWNFISTSPCFS